MHRQNGTGPVCYFFFYFSRINGKGFLVCIGEHRQCLLVKHHIVGGNESIGGNDHLIPCIHSQHLKGGNQGGGTAGCGHCPPGSDQGRIFLFEPDDVVSLTAPPVSAAQHLQHGILRLLVPYGPLKPSGGPDRVSSLYGQFGGPRRPGTGGR